ncbi:MAG: DUF2203 family protein [Candidatus Xenobia bacterium]
MKLFDRASANALIPTVAPLMAEVAARHRELMAWVVDESGRVSHRIEEVKAELSQLLKQVQEVGGVVKDLELGLVDFPAIVGRDAVYLCWRMGELEIRYYHGVEEGFGGRKLLPDLASQA